MKTILCTTDFSESSFSAIKFAVSLAIKASARLVILHIYQVPYDSGTLDQEINYRLSGHAHQQIKKIEDQILANPELKDLDYKIISLPGEAIYAIHYQAIKIKADLIIMGVRGNSSAINHAILGSTTFEVARIASIPVLSIPQDFNNAEISKFIFSIDYKEEDFNTILKLHELAKIFGAIIDIIHVSEKNTLYEKILFKGFKEIVRENIGLDNIEFHLIINEDFYEGIKSFIIQQPGAILVMTHYKRSFPGILFSKSITEEILKKASMPLLIYKA
jgi:nucleotide-binding universal stress UspA family protein